jgi:lipoyl(octanoyl) transferase
MLSWAFATVHCPDHPGVMPHAWHSCLVDAGDLQVVHMGVAEYRDAHALQERLRAARIAGVIGDTLLLLEHRPVYTRGRRPDPGGLPMGEEWYRRQGIDVVETKRGGRVTYHGPGQLVGYPIMEVDDVVAFVRTMERSLVAALADEGLAAHARTAEGPDYTGVWIEERKVASIGLHVTRGITTHGFAVNVLNDLQPFEWIVACGLPGVRMTSVQREQRRADDPMPCFRRRVGHRFAEAHGRRQRLLSPARLAAALETVAA